MALTAWGKGHLAEEWQEGVQSSCWSTGAAWHGFRARPSSSWPDLLYAALCYTLSYLCNYMIWPSCSSHPPLMQNFPTRLLPQVNYLIIQQKALSGVKEVSGARAGVEAGDKGYLMTALLSCPAVPG